MREYTQQFFYLLCPWRSEEHTSELQSQSNLVCRLLLEKKKDVSPIGDASPAGSFPRHQRGQGDGAECGKGHDGIGGVRILPLPAQLLPVIRYRRPIVGRLIGRVGPDEENDKRESNAKKPEQRQGERRALTAQQQCERKIGDQGGDQHDAEQVPAAVDVLHDEILLCPQAHFVEELKQVRTARHQCKRGKHECKELNDFEGHEPDLRTALRAFCRSRRSYLPKHSARVARLFAPAALRNKLIRQRFIKRRDFRPWVSGEGESEETHRGSDQ